MQRRYVDRGIVYSYRAWRNMFGGTLAPGIYRGFDLTVDGSGDVLVGDATHSESEPGYLMLPSGIGLSEDHSFTIDFTVPGGPQDYTIVVQHVDNDLVGGVAATYYITNTLLTEQPTDGTILGWIRYDGTGSLTQSMITEASKLRGDFFAQDSAARVPIELNAPQLVYDLHANATEVSGIDTTETPNLVWRGVTNAITAGVINSEGWLQWEVKAEPYKFDLLQRIDGAGTTLTVYVYDTLGTLVKQQTFTANSQFTSSEVLIPQGTDTWIQGGTGTVKLLFATAIGTTIKLARLVVDSWPYAISRI